MVNNIIKDYIKINKATNLHVLNNCLYCNINEIIILEKIFNLKPHQIISCLSLPPNINYYLLYDDYTFNLLDEKYTLILEGYLYREWELKTFKSKFTQEEKKIIDVCINGTNLEFKLL